MLAAFVCICCYRRAEALTVSPAVTIASVCQTVSVEPGHINHIVTGSKHITVEKSTFPLGIWLSPQVPFTRSGNYVVALTLPQGPAVTKRLCVIDLHVARGGHIIHCHAVKVTAHPTKVPLPLRPSPDVHSGLAVPEDCYVLICKMNHSIVACLPQFKLESSSNNSGWTRIPRIVTEVDLGQSHMNYECFHAHNATLIAVFVLGNDRHLNFFCTFNEVDLTV